MKRVWIYCRVAADHNRRIQEGCQMAMDAQKTVLKDFADANGCSIVGTTTEFCSGLTCQREGLQKVQSAADEGLIDVVLVKSIGRIGRDLLTTIQYAENLKSVGVSILALDAFLRLKKC